MNRLPSRGFTLIELMVSLMLGLIVIGGVVSVMLANKRSFSTNTGLGQVQESARTAFELIARDIRQSGGTGCDNNGRIANVLTAAGGFWWQNWFGVRGIDNADTDPAVAFGSTYGTRVVGTDAIHVQSLDGAGFAVLAHNAAGASLQVQDPTPAPAPNFVANDIVVVCDFDHATIFQAQAYNAATRTISHAAGGAGPGNCSSGLGFPTLCDGAGGNIHPFPQNSPVARLNAVDWYVGNNDRVAEGRRSLFRRRLGPGGVELTEEIVAGVTNIQVRYRMANSDLITDATGVTDWDDVNAIFIELTADSTDANITTSPTVNEGRISKTFNFLITLRNRVQ